MVTAQIQKWGGANAIRLPKTILKLAEIREDAKLEFIIAEKGSILLRQLDENKKLTIDEIFEGYNGSYKGGELDWGKPVGEEVW